jgi:8-oxo-dGTP pyrophosphatase MutT (NUDIX family)
MENRKIKSRCIFKYQGKILLCYNTEFNYYFFPGGSAHKGEAPEDTLKREVSEEFGTEIKDIKFLTTLRNVGEVSDETITMFQAEFVNSEIYQESEIPVLDLPQIKAVWVSMDDVTMGKVKIFPEFNYLKLINC